MQNSLYICRQVMKTSYGDDFEIAAKRVRKKSADRCTQEQRYLEQKRGSREGFLMEKEFVFFFFGHIFSMLNLTIHEAAFINFYCLLFHSVPSTSPHLHINLLRKEPFAFTAHARAYLSYFLQLYFFMYLRVPSRAIFHSHFCSA